jgi:hypothetical protein
MADTPKALACVKNTNGTLGAEWVPVNELESDKEVLVGKCSSLTGNIEASWAPISDIEEGQKMLTGARNLLSGTIEASWTDANDSNTEEPAEPIEPNNEDG